MKLDHVAVSVHNNKVKDAAAWYTDNMSGEILYLDDTWALLKVHDINIALVSPSEHPPHVSFSINRKQYDEFKKASKVFKEHRDGSESFYTKDISGNILEFVFWKKNGKEN
tara:strand:- start:1137 stop:1469 length:333 start_codon:yes stop_codon:yes gene_type:complete